MTRPALIDLNPFELNLYPFMISLDKCYESCNAVNDLSTKICVPSKTKDVNVKVFNMITRINEAKTLVKHVYVIVNANSIVQLVIQIKNGIIVNVNMSWKNILCAKKVTVRILVCKNGI